jgi:hypothetical protein
VSDDKLKGTLIDVERRAAEALMRHGWSGGAAEEFVDLIVGAAVLRVADLQRRALSAEGKSGG